MKRSIHGVGRFNADRSIIIDQIKRRCPEADPPTVAQVAVIWQAEVDRIVERMLKYSAEAVGFGCHYLLRDEIAFHLAQLSVWLSDLIVSTRLNEVGGCAGLSASRERELAETPKALARVEQTARNMAHAWSGKIQEWQRRTETLLAREGSTRKLKPRLWYPGRPRVLPIANNHYVPRFSNRFWADSNGSVLEYSPALGGGVRAEACGYTEWGSARYLYSARVEAQLSAIEGDAQTPYMKLVGGRPFSGPNERDWIAFLVAQILRTPRFILKNISALSYLVKKNKWDYPQTPARLRAAYETIFSDSGVYTGYHRAIESKSWWIGKTTGAVCLIKSDEPVLLTGPLTRIDSSLVMPLSPTRCFVAGPLLRRDSPPLRVGEVDLTDAHVRGLNRAFARNARRSVIARIADDSPEMRSTLSEVLCLHPDNLRQWTVPPYWGPSAI